MSMWISNTATAIMMLPIATSVVAVLEPQQREKLSRPILLSVAWAANIGGMATLIGTPPNMIFAGFMSEQLNKQIGFVEWLPIGLSAS
ncbi:MAG TPA: anion transporter, partial [Cryomorphaceae bacterium]|nr:anion transporter [Cryomorphaceae bacterium]